MATLYDFEARDIEGRDRKLSEFEGRVCLVVNVASECGLTPQYDGLQRLYDRYRDRDFNEQEIDAGSVLARVVQHEYDHLEGVLFTDYLSSFRKRLLRRSLRKMTEGDVEADYPLVAQGDEPVQAR